MKTKFPVTINLASDPFRRERADTAGFTLICVLLGCSLIVLTGLDLHSRSEASDIRRRISLQETQLAHLRIQQNQYSTVLTKPENANAFATSLFLNQIIARRGISWTRVFQDLSTVMPASVRLLAIRLPQVDSEDEKSANRVQLDMIVGTSQPEAVIGLFKNLQKSGLFGAASLVSQTPPAQNDPLYKYRVTVPYDQKL
jgi:type IV pilus assembly protein PilN